MQASAISNGRLLPNIVDGRSAWCRRAKDLIANVTADLGGDDNISTAEQILIRRAVTLTVECERREVLFAVEGQIDDQGLMIYQTAANALKRLLETLGLERRMRTIEPSLFDLLRADLQAQREQHEGEFPGHSENST